MRTFPERRARPGRSAIRYLRRAVSLRCPTCGNHPIFKPIRETRSVYDWIAPLDGCPQCRYRYEREPGYFLLATFAFNYGAVLTLGFTLWAFSEWFLDLTIAGTLAFILVPMALASVSLIRHSKALFLAMDLWIDPR